jgi:hypothetical protein
MNMIVIGVNTLFSKPLIFCILNPFDSFIAPADEIEPPAKRLRPDSAPDDTRATGIHTAFPHNSQLLRQLWWICGWDDHSKSEIEHLKGTLNFYHLKNIIFMLFSDYIFGISKT